MYDFEHLTPRTINHEDYNSYSIPERYNEDTLVLMVRDPYWGFSYWEVSDNTKNNLGARLGEEKFNNSKLTVRIYYGNMGDASNLHSQFFTGYANSWYLNLNSPDTTFWGQLGLLTPDGEFIVVATSNSITTPSARISEIEDQEWLTIEEAYRYFKIPMEQVAGSPTLLERLKKIEFHKLDMLPGSEHLMRPKKRK